MSNIIDIVQTPNLGVCTIFFILGFYVILNE
jgi:hypothetical protein